MNYISKYIETLKITKEKQNNIEKRYKHNRFHWDIYMLPEDVPDLISEVRALRKALTTAEHALRSYQYGNASTELAREIADYANDILESKCTTT